MLNNEIEEAILELNSNVNNLIKNQIDIKNNKVMPLSENLDGDFYKKANFSDYIRKGNCDFLKKSLSDKEETCGTFFIPNEISMRVSDKLNLLSPMRSISRIISVSSNSVEFLTDSKMPEAGWVSKSEEKRNETNTPEIQKIKIPVHEIYAKPKVSQKLLDDAQIDVEEWLVSKIAEKLASLENEAFVKGNGNDKPRGFLSVESENKEERAWGKLQHFYSGAAGKFEDSNTAFNILIDVVCSLKPKYARNAKWIMSRSVLSEIKKLKKKDGTYLWQPSLSQASPSTLLGYPVIIDDDMPALVENSNSTSVAFGDFYSGYQIVDRQGLKILRDPYTSKPFVEFYASTRVGGDVIDFDAIKLLKFEEKPQQ